MKKLKQIFLAVVVGLIFINPVLVVAQTTSTTIDVPEYNGVQESITNFLCTPSEGSADSNALTSCINKMYRFGVSFGAIALVFFLVFAGYTYMVGGESGKEKAKGILQNALIGIGLLLGSYVILSFINPSLVLIKPIQPPIFTAADLPKCEDIGFEDTCVIDGGEVVKNGGAGKGEKVPCPGKEIVTIGSLKLPGDSGLKICKAFGEKLLQAYNQTKSTPWVITSTIRDKSAESQCHMSGNEYSGTCADMDFTGADATKVESWNALCRAIKGAGLYPHNEVGHEFKATLNDCGKFNEQKFAKKDHLHTAWFSGGGGGGGTYAGGSKPSCIPVKEVNAPGLCDDGVAGTRAGLTWENTNPKLKAAADQLSKEFGLSISQAYRPPEYGAHMRSIFEAKALLDFKWTDDQLSKHGQYCQTTGIKYVTKADVDKYDDKAKAYVRKHFQSGEGLTGHFGSINSPTTCLSDHGKGIAFDFANMKGKPSAKLVNAARKLGLCPSVPFNKQPSGFSMNPDYPHFVLFEFIPGKESSCVSY